MVRRIGEAFDPRNLLPSIALDPFFVCVDYENQKQFWKGRRQIKFIQKSNIFLNKSQYNNHDILQNWVYDSV